MLTLDVPFKGHIGCDGHWERPTSVKTPQLRFPSSFSLGQSNGPSPLHPRAPGLPTLPRPATEFNRLRGSCHWLIDLCSPGSLVQPICVLQPWPKLQQHFVARICMDLLSSLELTATCQHVPTHGMMTDSSVGSRLATAPIYDSEMKALPGSAKGASSPSSRSFCTAQPVLRTSPGDGLRCLFNEKKATKSYGCGGS